MTVAERQVLIEIEARRILREIAEAEAQRPSTRLMLASVTGRWPPDLLEVQELSEFLGRRRAEQTTGEGTPPRP